MNAAEAASSIERGEARAMKPVEVSTYSGYRGDQEPRSVVLEGRRLRVEAIEGRWREFHGDCFDVLLENGARLRLRMDLGGRWWLEETPEG